MSFWLTNRLSNQTSIFGLKLWLLLAICASASAAAALLFLLLLLSLRRRLRRLPSPTPSVSPPPLPRKPLKLLLLESTPQVSKQILPISPVPNSNGEHRVSLFLNEHHNRLPLPPPPPSASASASTSGESKYSAAAQPPRDVNHLGWGQWFTLRELELATDHFADENVIGEGGYGIVYRGVLDDHNVVAVKNLLNNRGQAEREFKVEVEAMGRVRHKNLVKLLGFCVEGAHRMLVYEYVDNGNLDQWLHGDVGDVSPLTWDIRMNILLGTAKGLAYLHEGLEPKVVHRDVKSSNILLDQKWNPKVSDFGLAKLLCSERTYVTTRVMGTFGYVAPEYASTGMLNERSDVYSFGVLIMEIISGRTPVDYTKPPGEMNLVKWLKTMVGERRSEQVVDPKIQEKPSPKSLKRMLLVALHCVDPDAQKRPKMGHVIHMIEEEDLLFKEERRGGWEPAGNPCEMANFGRSSYQTGWR